MTRSNTLTIQEVRVGKSIKNGVGGYQRSIRTRLVIRQLMNSPREVSVDLNKDTHRKMRGYKT